jgi:hypothetical protein
VFSFSLLPLGKSGYSKIRGQLRESDPSLSKMQQAETQKLEAGTSPTSSFGIQLRASIA